MQFLYSLQSEWIKTKKTAAAWLVVIGAFFIPLIIVAIRYVKSEGLAAMYKSPQFWQGHFFQNWQTMAFLLLPMGVILSTSLITQIEYRNNTWKQLHSTPQFFSTIFFAKLTVILLMMLQFFILFNIGIFLSGITPLLFSKKAVYPAQPFPFEFFLKTNAKFFIGCLPIVAMQYLLSLRFKNFMLPLGTGLVLLIASTFAIQWKYGYTLPYTYTGYTYLQTGASQTIRLPVNIQWLSLAVFVLFTATGYLLYITKKDKC
jgi:lantibiotic transport system permease protein